MLDAAARFMREHDDILFIAHVSPDGDTLGSCLALMLMMEQMQKRAQIVCEEPVPAIYRFLPGAERVLPPAGARQTEAVVCVDCADAARAGDCRVFFDRAAYSFNIDHHGTNRAYAQGNFVKAAAATGELVYALLERLELELTPDIAACLFAAIATDTGNFAYSNTTPDTFRISAALLETGIDLPELNRRLFRTLPYRKVKLLGLAITKTRLYLDGRLGMAAVTQADLRDCGASGEDAEGIIDSIRDIDTVELAVLLRESTDGRIRASLRAKTHIAVDRIAAAFGGGGHRFAAGCTLDAPIETACARLKEAAEAVLRSAEA
ncbi:MAG: bifunctional oligoribonuclease/PAP phosphatase NrnA [Clostridia bacterium]|nr:bifunctional oligoribonuclease/PAP phosphatase NrnA [Clostridia bacterium]